MDDNLNDNKKFICPICGKSFKNSHSLSVHKSKYHRASSSLVPMQDTKVNDNKPNDSPASVSSDIIPTDNLITTNDTLNVKKADFSQDDLEKTKEILDQTPELKEISGLLDNMTDEEGKELYMLMIEGFGDLNGIDIDTDMPDMVKKADMRGKHLAFVVNRYAKSIQPYIIPAMLVGGIGLDFLAIRKAGQLKKLLNKKNKNQTNNEKGDEK